MTEPERCAAAPGTPRREGLRGLPLDCCYLRARLQAAGPAARSIGNSEAPAEVLDAVAPGVAAVPRRALHPLWRSSLLLRMARTHSDLHSDLGARETVLLVLVGQEAVVETCCAIQDMCRW